MVARLEKKLPTPLVKNVGGKALEKAAKSPGGSFAKGGDSLSTGRGGALRQNAAKLLGSTGLSSNVPLLARNAGGAVKHDFDIKKVGHNFDGAGSLDPAVAAAAKNVEKAYASSSDPKARDKAVLDAIKKGAEQFANDPAKAAAYASAIGPTVTKLATDLAARKDDKGIKGLLKDLGDVAQKLGPRAALTLGASVARGLPDTKDLYYVDDALKSSPLALSVLVGLADQGKVNSARDLLKSTFGPLLALDPIGGLEALSNAKFPPELAGPLATAFAKIGEPLLANVFATKALDPLAGATKAADEANAEVVKLQGDLNQELEHVPQADRHAYEQLFWKEHQSALDAASKANEALKVEVEKSLPQVKALAAAGNEAAAKQLEKSLAALANDPAQSDFVSSTIEGLKVNGAFPKPFHEQPLVDAYAAAKQGKANLLLASGDSAGAAKVLDDILGFLDTTQFLTTGIAELKKPLENFVAVLRTGDAKKISSFLTGEGEKDVLALSKSSQALGAVVTGLGIAVTLVKGFESGTDSEGRSQDHLRSVGPGRGSRGAGPRGAGGRGEQRGGAEQTHLGRRVGRSAREGPRQDHRRHRSRHRRHRHHRLGARRARRREHPDRRCRGRLGADHGGWRAVVVPGDGAGGCGGRGARYGCGRAEQLHRGRRSRERSRRRDLEAVAAALRRPQSPGDCGAHREGTQGAG
ncbi:MAG: hypothetical protein QM817_22415 [Archangium sp.]